MDLKYNLIRILLIIILLHSNYGNADFYNGSQLFELLKYEVKGGSGYTAGVGVGYITGFYDAMRGSAFCPPDSGLTIGQITQITYNFMQKHPEIWDKPAVFSVMFSFREVWPCEKK